MLVNDLANKIRTLPLDGEPPIRVAYLEPGITFGIVVKTPIPGLTENAEMPGYLKGMIQILVRTNDPVQADTMCRAITAAITVKGDPMTLTDYKLTCFVPAGEPVMYPLNIAGLWEFSTTYDCTAIRL